MELCMLRMDSKVYNTSLDLLLPFFTGYRAGTIRLSLLSRGSEKDKHIAPARGPKNSR